MEIRKRKLRITFFYLAVLCILIGVISTYVYTRISQELSGSSGMLDFSRVFGGETESVRGIHAAVLRSEQTADYLVWVAENRSPEAEESDRQRVTPEETRQNYYAMSTFWMEQLEENKIRAELVNEADLVSGETMEPFNLLIMPATYCLSDEQVEAVKGFLKRRKSVVFTHFSGNRFEEGGDRPWSLLADVVGADLSHPSTNRLEENATRLIFIRDNPVTADIPPGRALPITTFDRPVAGRIRDATRAAAAAVWPDAADFLPVDPAERAAVVYGDYRGGRFVWFGFTAQSVQPGPRHWPHFRKLIQNALHWAGRQPTVGRAAWPGGKIAAATVGVLARNTFYESSGTERMLQDADIPYAVYVPAGEGTQVMPSSAVRSREAVETGLFTQMDFLDISVGPEAISTLNSERNEFQNQWDLEVHGLAMDNPPSNIFEPSDYLRFNYLWMVDESRFAPRQVPFGRGTKRPFFSRTPDPLVMLGQSVRSDRRMVQGLRITDAERFAEGLVRDLERVRGVGGLYSITLESEFSDAFAGDPALEAWTEALGANDIWRADPREIAAWWTGYSGIKLQINQEGARFTLRMTNESNQKVEEFRLYIYPSLLPETLEIRAERMRTPIPDYRIRNRRSRIELTVVNMSPNENRTYYIDF